MKLNIRCTGCKQFHRIEVPAEGLQRWQRGELIQQAMPNVSIADRELLISKTCSDCFDKLYGEEAG